MRKDKPYSDLMKNTRDYEILLFGDQQHASFRDIAAKYNLSEAKAAAIYKSMKAKQINLYIHHIATALEKDDIYVRYLYLNAMNCYWDQKYACTFMEKSFADILTAYRDGEPGMPAAYIEAMPPFTLELDENTVFRIVDLYENRQLSFPAIAKALHITPKKAKRTYDLFYHEKYLDLVRVLQKKAETTEEKNAIWSYYLNKYESKPPKRRYELLMEEHPFLKEKI